MILVSLILSNLCLLFFCFHLCFLFFCFHLCFFLFFWGRSTKMIFLSFVLSIIIFSTPSLSPLFPFSLFFPPFSFLLVSGAQCCVLPNFLQTNNDLLSPSRFTSFVCVSYLFLSSSWFLFFLSLSLNFVVSFCF